jgi:hypothetical protein
MVTSISQLQTVEDVDGFIVATSLREVSVLTADSF